MALRPPNPNLATESVTVVPRNSVVYGTMGDISFPPGTASSPYPAIVTMQMPGGGARTERDGTVIAQSVWLVVLFTTTDPGVHPDDLIQYGTRNLIATHPSTFREAGEWLVMCREFA